MANCFCFKTQPSHGRPLRKSTRRATPKPNNQAGDLEALFPTRRDAVAYILDQLPIVRRKDEQRFGEYRTKRVILEAYDALAEAQRTGRPQRSKLNLKTGNDTGELQAPAQEPT